MRLEKLSSPLDKMSLDKMSLANVWQCQVLHVLCQRKFRFRLTNIEVQEKIKL